MNNPTLSWDHYRSLLSGLPEGSLSRGSPGAAADAVDLGAPHFIRYHWWELGSIRCASEVVMSFLAAWPTCAEATFRVGEGALRFEIDCRLTGCTRFGFQRRLGFAYLGNPPLLVSHPIGQLIAFPCQPEPRH